MLGGIALASALAGASSTVSAQDWDFTAWDTDGDGMLTDEEWGVGVYDIYDVDDDGLLDDDEYATFYGFYPSPRTVIKRL